VCPWDSTIGDSTGSSSELPRCQRATKNIELSELFMAFEERRILAPRLTGSILTSVLYPLLFWLSFVEAMIQRASEAGQWQDSNFRSVYRNCPTVCRDRMCSAESHVVCSLLLFRDISAPVDWKNGDSSAGVSKTVPATVPGFRGRILSSSSGGAPRWDGETVLRTPEVVFRTPPPVTGRVGDVNPPVTVRARAANTASGTHQGRTGRLTSAARHTAFS
jgi:hypothetical protein